ncbi:MAG: Prolyl oligopeptidase family protein [Rhodanobacteraceae bacterium]|jgi:dipeptidyl aminopeptidase/acylaminoacyl peptidase|nr:MAG: Prolyl oligopeptidase family protein [Rhodanobacteraceae bacterium]
MFARYLAAATLLVCACACGAATPPASATSAPAAGAAGSLLPVSAFAARSLVSNPRLSPDGDYLAVRTDSPSGEEHGLAIYRLSDMKVVSLLHLPIYEVPVDMVWVSPTWLVVELGKEFGSLDKPLATGEVIASNIDGTRQHYLYGYKPISRRAAVGQADEGFGSIVGLPPKVDGTFYLGVESWSNENRSTVYRVNAQHDTRNLVADMPVANMNFLIDPEGKAAFAFGNNSDFDYVAYRYADDRWTQLGADQAGHRFAPFAYAPDGQDIYAWWSKDGGPLELIEQNQNGSDRRILAQDVFSNIENLQWTAPPRQPFAAIAESGIPQPIFIDTNLPAAQLYQSLQKNFPGEFVDFIDFSEDGSKLLFFVSSDRDPGAYYLLDAKTRKANKLLAVEQWINPADMAERRPIRFKASDGLELDGFLTIPPHRSLSDLPMVLVPHGGPHGVEDDWFYDDDAQFLANRGYLVLQVNYRGSGGRGPDFEHAGYLKWGTRIQQDLIDGVQWAIGQHYADPKRICVYGGSFGGYSALMSAIRAPHLFKCAIGYSGVYDLKMMYEKGDVQDSKTGRSYLSAVIGRNDADLDANSPDKLADKIDVPVFLAHGEDDKRAPFAQAEAMRDALQAAHKSFEWMAVPYEGHGFYTEADRAAFLTKMQAFLEKYIGPGAPAQH